MIFSRNCLLNVAEKTDESSIKQSVKLLDKYQHIL
jgi:hypothetical protein